MTATQPVRQTNKPETQNEGDIEALREEAKTLGINSSGLSRGALKASIAAVKKVLENQTPVAPTVEETSEPRADALGEPLGPNAIKRIPMGSRSVRLGGEQRPGYYRYWFTDTPGRIERARMAGYEHVKNPKGEPMSTPCGTHEHGGGMRQYLMEIPNELREQDVARKRAVNDDIDRMLNRGKISDQKEDRRYVPDTGISITRR